MKLLIDSSTNYSFLALYDNQVIDTMVRQGKNDHSETLIDCLEKLLEKNNVDTKDINEILVGRGPGSYTGVRISGTIAKVLALVRNCKLYSFSTLDLLLCHKVGTSGTYIARIVAKKNHSYYKVATITNKEIKVIVDDAFSIDTELAKYDDLTKIEVNDELFENASELAKNIVELKLYKEEDVFNYVPNYLRSEINGYCKKNGISRYQKSG